MPTFDTSEPISVTIHLAVGDTKIIASERTDTVVEVRPSNKSTELGVKAHSTVGAKTASGNVRIGEVMRGSVMLDTASGELEVGVRAGTAAWLDIRSWSGSVHNSLETSDGPERSDETVKVRARTYSGDITIRRS